MMIQENVISLKTIVQIQRRNEMKNKVKQTEGWSPFETSWIDRQIPNIYLDQSCECDRPAIGCKHKIGDTCRQKIALNISSSKLIFSIKNFDRKFNSFCRRRRIHYHFIEFSELLMKNDYIHDPYFRFIELQFPVVMV